MSDFITVNTPTGPVRFPKGMSRADMAAALNARSAQKPAGAENPEFSDYATQAGAGSQQGIARMLGFPVDAVTSAINGVGDLTGLYDPIENPVGGSQWIDEKSGMTKLRQNVPEPSTPGLKAARRVGEEVGASAAGFPIAMASPLVRAQPVTAAAVEAGSALGSGAASAGAQYLAPDSITADIVASLTGGLVGGKLASSIAGGGNKSAVVRSGVDEQKAIADDAYSRVRADQTPLPQGAADDLKTSIQQRMDQERMNPRLHSGVNNVVDAITDDIDAGKVVRAEDVEELRRLPEANVSATATPAERRLSAILKDEITSNIDNTGMQSADDLRIGRDANRRKIAAQGVQEAREQAERSAASTGSGGNEINRTRQKLRAILDSPRKRRSFKPEELEMMEKVVRGDVSTNTLRRLSRFAPTSGGLSAMLGIGGAMASPAIALPIMAGTEIAKYGGEKATQKAIDALMRSIAPDRVTATSQPGVEQIIRALLAARTTASATQGNTGTR